MQLYKMNVSRSIRMFPFDLRVMIRRFTSFDLSDENLNLQKTCRDFADKELKPIASQLDKEQRFPTEQIKKLGQLGLLGINVDAHYGGSGMRMLSTSIAVEELSRGCASTGIIVSLHNCLYAHMLANRGTEQQKEIFLKPFMGGDIGVFVLSEHDAGSDVVNMNTKAVEDGDYYILNGIKAWVTSGYEAKAGIIFATIDKSLKHKGITAFLVPFHTPGICLGKKDEKLGIRATSTCDVILQDVRVHKENIIGNIGEGFIIAMAQLQVARIGVASQAIGIGQAALDLAVDYASTRNMFGKPLIDMQLIKSKIAKMSVALESARLLTWKAATLADTGRDFRKLSSMAKYAASRCATTNAHTCVQILGGMGYVTDMAAERHYRDARITQIYGGVTDVQKLIIADRVVKEY